MKFGLFATFMSPRADRYMIKDFAQQCEAIGLESVWMGEHVVLFDETENPYPGSADGKIPVPAGGGMLDTVGTFGYMSAVTERIRFGMNVASIALRELATAASTLVSACACNSARRARNASSVSQGARARCNLSVTNDCHSASSGADSRDVKLRALSRCARVAKRLSA